MAAVVSGSALGIVFACLYPYAACVACVAAVAGRRSLRHASRRRLAALCAAVGASFLLYVLYLRLLAPGPAAPVVDRPETLEAFRVRRRAEADPMPVLGRMLLATVAVVVAVALVPLALPWLRLWYSRACWLRMQKEAHIEHAWLARMAWIERLAEG